MTAAIGVDVGGTKILGVAVDDAAPDVRLAEMRVETEESQEDVLAAMAGVIGDLVVAARRAGNREVRDVGVGIAGLVDLDGVLRVSPNMRHMLDVNVAAEMRRRVQVEGEPVAGAQVRVDNDANCAAWGEHVAGAGQDRPNMLMLTFGTGIGAGLIEAGKLVRGAQGFGGEAGHMVVDRTGPPCPCGRWGCWERVASGNGLARLGRDAADAGQLRRAQELAARDQPDGGPHLVRGEHVTAAAREGDDEALAVLDRFADVVALGVGNLVTFVDVSRVVIGGGLVEMGDLLLGRVRSRLPANVMNQDERNEVEVVPAELGSDAGAVGAALLAAHARATP